MTPASANASASARYLSRGPGPAPCTITTAGVPGRGSSGIRSVAGSMRPSVVGTPSSTWRIPGAGPPVLSRPVADPARVAVAAATSAPAISTRAAVRRVRRRVSMFHPSAEEVLQTTLCREECASFRGVSTQEEPRDPGSGEPGATRELSDPAALKALGHPLRQQILRHLHRDGPATATTLAAALGENTGATSYHLRQLAE